MGEVLATSAAIESELCSFDEVHLPAHIRFDAEVDSLVILQVVQLEKGFWAQLTLMTSLSKVISFDMVTEDGGELVLFLTKLARKHCLAFLVDLICVSVQRALPSKGFTTLITGMFPQARRVKPHVAGQV